MQETLVQFLGQEDPLREGKGYPLQYSGLENSMDHIDSGVTKGQTGPRDFHFLWFFICDEAPGYLLAGSS